MSRLSKSVIVLAMLWVYAACSGRESTPTTQRYPATRKVDVVDNYFGTKVADPYRWLENLDSPEVREWAVAAVTVATTRITPQTSSRSSRPSSA